MPLDPNQPLPDISADEPAGPNLEFDGEFSEFERLALGKPEQQYGTTVVPAEEPVWKDVVAAGWSLLDRTYDLRVFAQLAVARLQREGLTGYAETLAFIRQALETHWVAVHPQLDPEDDNDPTLRANALLTIVEPVRVVRYLRYMPLARSARAGAVSWRDIAIFNGTVEVEEDYTKMTGSVISAAFRESDPSATVALRNAIASCIESATAIPAAFDAEAGYGTGPDFADLVKLFHDMQRMLDNYAATPTDQLDTASAASADEGQDGGTADLRASRSPGGMSVASLSAVTNRADAVRLLDLVIEYYERNEPSSPLPLLIARARRLADKGFLDLVRDLAPDGLGQAERMAGTPET